MDGSKRIRTNIFSYLHVCLIAFEKHHRLRAPSILCRASVALTIYWVLSRPAPLCPVPAYIDESPQSAENITLYPAAAAYSNTTGSDDNLWCTMIYMSFLVDIRRNLTFWIRDLFGVGTKLICPHFKLSTLLLECECRFFTI